MTINSQNGNTLLESGFFPPCRAATTAAIALSGLQTIDGVALIAGDRVLVKDQTDRTTNGIYAASTGNWVRASDAAGNTQFFDGMAVVVALGTVNAGQIFICTSTDDPVVVGTSLLTFASQSSVQQALQQATSASSAALTVGAKTFVTQAGKAFSAKQWLLIYETSNPDNSLLAEITSYSGTSLVVSVAAVGGSGGPYTDWTIVLANSPAGAGRVPPVGSGNFTGPGSSVAGHIVTFGDTSGKVGADSGIPAGTLAGRNSLLYGDAGAKSIPASALTDGAAPLTYCAAQPTDNLVLSNDGTNPTRDIQVSPGRCRDLADVANLQLTGAILKRLDTAWAAGGVSGSPQGCLDSGSSKIAFKTYHVYAIGKLGMSVTSWSRSANVVTLAIAGHGLGVGGSIRCAGVLAGVDGLYAISAVPDSGHVSFANSGTDVGATSVTGAADGFDILASQADINAYPSPALPAGWIAKQCLGSVMCDSSANILAFVQSGDIFEFKTPQFDVNVNNPGTSAVSRQLAVPTGVSVLVWLMANLTQTSTVGGAGLRVSALDSVDDAPTTYNCDLAVGESSVGGNNFTNSDGAQLWVRTSTGALVRTRLSASSTNLYLYIHTRGWRDPRRRLF